MSRFLDYAIGIGAGLFTALVITVAMVMAINMIFN